MKFNIKDGDSIKKLWIGNLKDFKYFRNEINEQIDSMSFHDKAELLLTILDEAIEQKDAKACLDIALIFEGFIPANELKKLQQVIIDSKDIDKYVDFAHIEGADIKAFEQTLIKTGDAWKCYDFAKSVKGADVEALQKVVIDSKDILCCRFFARNVKGADIKTLEELTIKNGTANDCYEFAIEVKGADIDTLQQAVIDKQNLDVCFRFAENVKGADKEKLYDVLRKAGIIACIKAGFRPNDIERIFGRQITNAERIEIMLEEKREQKAAAAAAKAETKEESTNMPEDKKETGVRTLPYITKVGEEKDRQVENLPFTYEEGKKPQPGIKPLSFQSKNHR